MYSQREERLIRLYTLAALKMDIVPRSSRKPLICGNLSNAGFEDAAENARIVDDVVDDHSDFTKK